MLVRDWKDPGTGEAGNTLHLHPLVPQYIERLERHSLGRLTPVDTSDLPCPLNGKQALQGRAHTARICTDILLFCWGLRPRYRFSVQPKVQISRNEDALLPPGHSMASGWLGGPIQPPGLGQGLVWQVCPLHSTSHGWSHSTVTPMSFQTSQLSLSPAPSHLVSLPTMPLSTQEAVSLPSVLLPVDHSASPCLDDDLEPTCLPHC